MNRPLRRSGFATLALMLLVTLPAAATPEPQTVTELRVPAPAPWKAVAASGPVEAWAASVEEEVWARVSRGDELEPRTAVRTGARAHATLTRRSDIVMLNPKSRVALPAGGILDGDASVVQQSGSVLYEIDGSSDRDFRVVTPQLVAGVKGTIFMVTVTDGYASVSVEEGVVEVTSRLTGRQIEVHAGETALIDARETAEMDLVSRRNDYSRVDRTLRRLAREEARRMARSLDTLDESLAGEDEIADLLGEDDGDHDDRLHHELAEDEDNDLDTDDLDDIIDELSEDLEDENKRSNEQQPNPGGN